MNSRPGITEINPEIPGNAISIYGQSDNSYEDFPVLKAFQQYIDAEQAKARKRLVLMGFFFGGLMLVVISVFVGLLFTVSSRNQLLNDRLVEYAMKDRDQRSAPVVVQPPQDNTSVVLALTAKLDEMQKKLAETQASADKIAAESAAKAKQAEIEASKKNTPTPEQLEIERLKIMLAAEREKQSAERESRRKAELEEYRRKHYPELYEKPKAQSSKTELEARQVPISDDDKTDLLKEVDEILGDESDKPVAYFDDDNDKKVEETATSKKSKTKEYSIPVDIRGSSSLWSVPKE